MAKTPIWKVLWEQWKRIAAKIAHVQGHIILSVIYGVVVSPVALLFKLFGQDALRVKRDVQPTPSQWIPKPPVESVADFLKKEF